jgi:hypothetical protein
MTAPALQPGGNVGERVRVGPIDELLATVAAGTEPYYEPAARSYLVAYPPALIERAIETYPTALHTPAATRVTPANDDALPSRSRPTL